MLTLKKPERLHSKKLIEKLFLEGKTFLSYPLKVVYMVDFLPNGGAPVQAAFSVSKKLYKKAATRNQIKRRTREAYRLQKPGFYKALHHQNMAIMFIYIAKENLPYDETEKGMKKALKKLASIKG